MEQSKPVRKSHTSTADLLTWTESARVESRAVEIPSRPGILSHQVWILISISGNDFVDR